MENDVEVDLAQLIHRGGVFKNVEGNTPQEIYAKVCKMIDLPAGMTSETVYKALCDREAVLSTAVGNGIALPHARAPIMRDASEQRICVVYLKNPIDMKAPDEREVFVMFVLLAHNSQIHLKVLSSLAALFRDAKFKKALELRSDEATLASIIKELE
jgi:PTS system nitrogen regulatory IIA component